MLAFLPLCKIFLSPKRFLYQKVKQCKVLQFFPKTIYIVTFSQAICVNYTLMSISTSCHVMSKNKTKIVSRPQRQLWEGEGETGEFKNFFDWQRNRLLTIQLSHRWRHLFSHWNLFLINERQTNLSIGYHLCVPSPSTYITQNRESWQLFK